MQNISFNHLTDDAKILSIGDFFRKDTESRWGVNLDFYPKQNKSVLNISNAPILVRKRVLNPTGQNKPAGRSLSFSILNTCDWEIKKLSDYPVSDQVRQNEKEQLCFFFKADSGVSIYLPQFELARVLFLHNAYLSRTALEPDSLKAEFDIVTDDASKTSKINVLPTSGYPRNALDDDQSRSLLSWILIDREARASFDSIGWYQKLYGANKNGYRRWDFQFKPPLLPLAKFDVRGWNDPDSKSFFVYEITAIRNISVNIPDVVEVYHDQFTKTTGVKGVGGRAGSGMQPDKYDIQEGESANSDKLQTIIQAPVVVLEFASIINTVKVAKKEQKRASGTAVEASQEIVSKEVSVEEPTRTGQLAGADWNIVSDLTEDAQLYANKFECFQQMLAQLVEQHGCVIKSKRLRRLPQIARCKKHLLRDGSHRCIAVVELVVNEVSFYILEVDTSDAINSLSTMVFLLKSPSGWEAQLARLERVLVKKSLVWPSHLFDEFCVEKRFNGVPHPKLFKGSLDSDSVKHWADRVYILMQTMR
ncbi:MAG: hypothetical protein JSU84_07490 [Thiotrichales bacterium]|nr:MAG: hypothetical protein JSU84_07490 [Thiotrichales bacterium]